MTRLFCPLSSLSFFFWTLYEDKKKEIHNESNYFFFNSFFYCELCNMNTKKVQKVKIGSITNYQMSICGNIPISGTPEAPFPHTYSSTNPEGMIILSFFVVLLSIYKFLNLIRLKFFLLLDFITVYVCVLLFSLLCDILLHIVVQCFWCIYILKCSGYIPRSRMLG